MYVNNKNLNSHSYAWRQGVCHDCSITPLGGKIPGGGTELRNYPQDQGFSPLAGILLNNSWLRSCLTLSSSFVRFDERMRK
jgi:hypothetical protein